jgi:hypothetical protein
LAESPPTQVEDATFMWHESCQNDQNVPDDWSIWFRMIKKIHFSCPHHVDSKIIIYSIDKIKKFLIFFEIGTSIALKKLQVSDICANHF